MHQLTPIPPGNSRRLLCDRSTVELASIVDFLHPDNAHQSPERTIVRNLSLRSDSKGSFFLV
jgi:hypothetical protein